jgi:hypothetical protein
MWRPDRLKASTPPGPGDPTIRAVLQNANDLTERLNPGGSANAVLRSWDHNTNGWTSGNNEITIYDTEDATYGRNFLLPGECVPVRQNVANGRYEIVGSWGLIRKVVIYEADGIAQDASGLVTIWTMGAETDPRQDVTAWNTWMDLGKLLLGREAYARYFPDEEKWVIWAVEQAHKWCKFSLTETMATSDADAEAEIELASWSAETGTAITVQNHATHAAGVYIFAGDNGDFGTANYRPWDDTWHIVQMECP